MPGSGKLELTGNLGDVMKESASAALSFIRANTFTLGIDTDFYKDLDALCEDLSVDKSDLISRLEVVGFEYNNELNQFK